MAHSPSPGGDRPRTEKIRPRWSWGRRLAFTALVLLVSVVVAHAFWGVAARRGLNRMVADLRRQGEPVLPEDFREPAVADADNAVPGLRAAAASIDRSDPRYKARFDMIATWPHDEAGWAAVKGFVDANRVALDEADAATARPGVNWGMQFRSPVILGLLSDLTPQRDLARLLADDALLAHHDGDDARALSRLRQVLFIGRAVGRQPLLVPHLVALGAGAMAADRLEHVAPTLSVRAGDADGTAGAATPAHVKALIADLLAYDEGNAGLARAMRGERMQMVDSVESILSGKITGTGGLTSGGQGGGAGGAGSISVYAIRPVLLNDARFMARYMTGVVAAATAPDWPAFEGRRPLLDDAEIDGRRYLHPIAALLLPSTDRSALQTYRGLAERRMAAAALAIRLYAADHDGRRPGQLADLVPTYLPAVPADPFTAGLPLAYLNGEAGASSHAGDPILYSVGENGADDGGSEAPSPTVRRHPVTYRWDQLDAVLHLAPRPAAP